MKSENGMMENWNIGLKRKYFDFFSHYSIIPIFHYSRMIPLNSGIPLTFEHHHCI